MMELRPAVVHRARPTPVFAFEDLSGLACGCVTATYRAAQTSLAMVSVEVKGPHCITSSHFVGQVLGLDGRDELATAIPASE